jgi:uncharacterized protein (UPF0276 family)
MVANVRQAQQRLPVPIAIENVAAVLEWPDAEMTEAQFLAELIDRTGARLLLDVENLYANWVNFGRDPFEALDVLPLEYLAYVHIAGGILTDGVWHDTHAHPVHPQVWALLEAVAERVAIPGVLLERDAHYPPDRELLNELGKIDHILRASNPANHRPMLCGGGREPATTAASSADSRRDLASAQRHLLASVVGSASPPAGFDRDRIRVQSEVLARKRAE